MTSTSLLSDSNRRSLAIDIWLFLVLALPLIGPVTSVAVTLGTLSVVSILCTVAILFAVSPGSDNRRWFHAQKIVPIAVSVMIILSWGRLLDSPDSDSLGLLFALIATVPIVIVWMSRSKFPRQSEVGNYRGLHKDQSNSQLPAFEQTTALDLDASLHATGSEADGSPVDDLGNESELESDFESPYSRTSDVTQWLTRSTTTDGEILEGGVRVDFTAGQRDATIHISFCPPLRFVPDLTTEDLDGAGLEIRVAALFPFGARLTIRRPATSLESNGVIDEACYRVGFVAKVAAARYAA